MFFSIRYNHQVFQQKVRVEACFVSPMQPASYSWICAVSVLPDLVLANLDLLDRGIFDSLSVVIGNKT